METNEERLDQEALTAQLERVGADIHRLAQADKSEDAWFLTGVAIGLYQAATLLGVDAAYPGPDPVTLALEGFGKDERMSRLYQVFLADGDMDFADDLPDGFQEEWHAFLQGKR